jgi:tRNA1(Val) A37 N6-methylase TrmN6
VELGCGSGFVSFGLSKFYNLPGMGIDVQEELKPLFYGGVAENDIKVKLDFESFDLLNIREHLKPESTALCVFNPPHYIDGRGEKNKDDVRGLTRAAGEEICDIFSMAASYLLKTKGYFSCVITPQNFENWQNAFRKNKLNNTRLWQKRMGCKASSDERIKKWGRRFSEIQTACFSDLRIFQSILI